MFFWMVVCYSKLMVFGAQENASRVSEAYFKKQEIHQANWLNPEFSLKHSGEQMSTRQIFLERVSWDMRVRLKLSKFFWTCKLRVGMNWESGVKGGIPRMGCLA